MKKNIIIIYLLIFSFLSLSPQEFTLIKGSNIYQRIFLFYFPLAKMGKYELFSEIINDKLRLEISIDKRNINREPSTPPLFKSGLVFIIKNIPLQIEKAPKPAASLKVNSPRLQTKKFKADVTVKCNYKMIFKEADFIVVKKGDILIIQGTLYDFSISEITKDPYYKNRLKWKLPLYFDIRLKGQKL